MAGRESDKAGNQKWFAKGIKSAIRRLLAKQEHVWSTSHSHGKLLAWGGSGRDRYYEAIQGPKTQNWLAKCKQSFLLCPGSFITRPVMWRTGLNVHWPTHEEPYKVSMEDCRVMHVCFSTFVAYVLRVGLRKMAENRSLHASQVQS